MNPLPPNADELVSAYLDGEAAPDEITLVESSPELLAQVDSLRGLALDEAVAPSASKEAHLSAALNVFDELFASEDTSATEPSSRPSLAAVPPVTSATTSAPTTPVPTPSTVEGGTAESGTVASFEQARERRRRRLSPTVIAAAIAAVALLLFAVLSSGSGTDDVAGGAATDRLEAASVSDAAADSGDDASGAMDETDAMDEDAMDDDEVEEASSSNAMSEAAPQAAAPAEPEASMDEEEAMADEAMAEEDAADAAEDSATDDALTESDGAAAGDSAADADDEEAMDEEEPSAGRNPPELFAFGDVSDQPLLKTEIESLGELDRRSFASVDLEGLFPTCRFELDELPDDEASLFGEGEYEGSPVEIHLVETPDERRVYVIAADECRVIFDFALGN